MNKLDNLSPQFGLVVRCPAGEVSVQVSSSELYIGGPVSNFTSGQCQTVANSHHRCASLSHLIVDTGVPLFLISKYCTDPNRQPARFFRDFEYPDCSTSWTLWHTLSPTSSKRNLFFTHCENGNINFYTWVCFRCIASKTIKMLFMIIQRARG